jgi:hypothetical protein
MGYFLLHEINEFHDPQSLPDAITSLYDSSGPLTPRDQLMYAWLLASLFHDYGYVDERQNQLIGLFKSLVPDVNITPTGSRDGLTWNDNMDKIRDFVGNLLGPTHFLYHFIDFVKASFDTIIDCRLAKDKKTAFIDHGILSANRLLNMIPLEDLDSQKRNIVLHAALAIACHNYVEILRKWHFGDKCRGHLSIGTFPVCSLLAFCDNVQTWDRESGIDPAIIRSEANDGLLERLVLSDTSYVSGSEICEISTNRRNDSPGYDFMLSIRYFVEAAGGVKEVCESLDHDIKKWINSGVLTDVCNTMGLSPFLHGQIVYKLPMLDKPCKAVF